MTRKSRQSLVALLFVFLSVLGKAQTIDTLPMVVLIDSSNNALFSSFNYTVDLRRDSSILPMSNLSELLQQKSGIFMKSYGPGMLSTPTFRGGDANHTTVSLNGIKLNSPMLGTTDFSLLPVGMFNGVDIYSGTSGNLFSSGGMGGGVNLSKLSEFNEDYYQLDYVTGSFGASGLSANFTETFKTLGIPIEFSMFTESLKSQNQFSYTNIYNEPYKREVMQHASFNKQNISASLALRPSQNLTISLLHWLSENERQLPNSINNGTESKQSQGDTVQRTQLLLNWKPKPWIEFTWVNHFEKNINHYADERALINNSNEFYNAQSLLDAEINPTKFWKIKIQLNPSFTEASSKNYLGYKQQFRSSFMFYAARALLKQRLILEAGNRMEWMDKNKAILPFGGVRIKTFKRIPIMLIGSFSKTVRFPTINELYWNPGGNSKLMPESGQMSEAGFEIETKRLESKVVYYRGTYINRIRWVPEGSLFSPINVSESKMAGIDLHASANFKLSSIRIKPYANLNLINPQSRFDESSEFYIQSFTPQIQSTTGIHLTYNSITINYLYTLTSRRYITSDESSYMPSFWITNCGLSWTKSFLSLRLDVLNLFNANYQNFPWRPMPGRSFQFGLRITIK
jgi:vitamin B12 transporter